ncbi:MAG: hypothetical protein NTY99_02000 [DPANN group archaeon]|nr:hypothetical protein [DPANN group archaeon]
MAIFKKNAKDDEKITSKIILELLDGAKQGSSVELIISKHQKELFGKPKIQNAILNVAKTLEVHIGTDDLSLVESYTARPNVHLYENVNYRDEITSDFCVVGNNLLVLADSPQPGYTENANMFLRQAKSLAVQYRRVFYDAFNKTL